MCSCKENIKHFKFWQYFYWIHDKLATINKIKFICTRYYISKQYLSNGISFTIIQTSTNYLKE